MDINNRARNFRKYKVWQDSVSYATKVYEVTEKFPWFEKKGLCDQLQRAAVSISSNIAEGAAKPSNVEFAHYLDASVGSSYEVETQLLIAKKIGYVKDDVYELLMTDLVEIEKQLVGFIKTLRQPNQ